MKVDVYDLKSAQKERACTLCILGWREGRQQSSRSNAVSGRSNCSPRSRNTSAKNSVKTWLWQDRFTCSRARQPAQVQQVSKIYCSNVRSQFSTACPTIIARLPRRARVRAGCVCVCTPWRPINRCHMRASKAGMYCLMHARVTGTEICRVSHN